MLSAGGYLALPMLLRRDLIRDRRLRMLWLGLALFIASDLVFGLWNETRIFGEVSPILAVTASLQIEQFLSEHRWGKEAD